MRRVVRSIEGGIAGCDLVCRSRRNKVRLDSGGGTRGQMLQHGSWQRAHSESGDASRRKARQGKARRSPETANHARRLLCADVDTSPVVAGNSGRCRLMQGRRARQASIRGCAQSRREWSQGAKCACAAALLAPVLSSVYSSRVANRYRRSLLAPS